MQINSNFEMNQKYSKYSARYEGTFFFVQKIDNTGVISRRYDFFFFFTLVISYWRLYLAILSVVIGKDFSGCKKLFCGFFPLKRVAKLL